MTESAPRPEEYGKYSAEVLNAGGMDAAIQAFQDAEERDFGPLPEVIELTDEEVEKLRQEGVL